MKFGGTSMGSPDRIKNVASIIEGKKDNTIVVVSAMSGTTNTLIDICCKLKDKHCNEAKQCVATLHEHYRQVACQLLETDECRQRAIERIDTLFKQMSELTKEEIFSDYEERHIVATGEQLSTKLLTEYLIERRRDVAEWNALHFMRTNNVGEVDTDYLHKTLTDMLSEIGVPKIIITQGFICRNAYGEVDNLQRGGSDYTATLISSAIQAESCEIWTDVSGVHTSDPRWVNNTHTIPHLHFDEAIALAYHGAKVLHPVCVAPNKQSNVPIRLLNTLAVDDEGTLIDGNHDDVVLKGMTTKDDIAVMQLTWNIAKGSTARKEMCNQITHYLSEIYLVHSTHTSLFICMEKGKHAELLLESMKQHGTINNRDDLSLLTLVGDGINAQITNTVIDIINAIRPHDIHTLSIGTSDNTITALIDKNYTKQILQQLNDALF